MSKLRMSIQKQNEKLNELSNNNDYFTIIDPVYNSEHINVIVKDKQQESTKMIVEHFYNRQYLIYLYEGNFEAIKKSVVKILITLFIIILVLLTMLIITFSYLENKSLSLIPLFTLIIITIIITFFIINLKRLKVISKVIYKEYQIDRKYAFLSLFKLLKEEKAESTYIGMVEGKSKYNDESST